MQQVQNLEDNLTLPLTKDYPTTHKERTYSFDEYVNILIESDFLKNDKVMSEIWGTTLNAGDASVGNESVETSSVEISSVETSSIETSNDTCMHAFSENYYDDAIGSESIELICKPTQLRRKRTYSHLHVSLLDSWKKEALKSKYEKFAKTLRRPYSTSFENFMEGNTEQSMVTGFNLKKSKCKHSFPKINCRFCYLSVECVHTEPDHKCKYCNKNLLCSHLTDRYKCVKCNGSEICEHSAYKYNCLTCKLKPLDICKHKILKMSCEACCVGWNKCKHSNLKSDCAKCSIKVKCKHSYHLFYCNTCNPMMIQRTYNLLDILKKIESVDPDKCDYPT